MVPSRRHLLLGMGASLVAALEPACTRFTVVPPAPGSDPDQGPAPGPTVCGVRLTTFRTDDDRAEGHPDANEVHTELWLLGADGRRELVHRSRDPAWTRADLAPGRYELLVVEVSDGSRAEKPHGRDLHRFDVREGQLADVRLTIRSVPWEALVVVFFVVVIVLVAAVLLGGGGRGGPPRVGLPRPPVPLLLLPPPILLPPRILWLPCDVYVGVPLVLWDVDLPPPSAPPPGPGVARVTPPQGPEDAVAVTFFTPMRASDLGPDTLQIVGPDGPVAVGVSVDEGGRSARVRPLRPLPPGRWSARVLGRALRDERGVPIGYEVQVPFTVR